MLICNKGVKTKLSKLFYFVIKLWRHELMRDYLMLLKAQYQQKKGGGGTTQLYQKISSNLRSFI